jgi:hypothetical protein
MDPLPTVLPTLQTARLRLRPLTTGDTADLFTIYGDPTSPFAHWPASAYTFCEHLTLSISIHAHIRGLIHQ